MSVNLVMATKPASMDDFDWLSQQLDKLPNLFFNGKERSEKLKLIKEAAIERINARLVDPKKPATPAEKEKERAFFEKFASKTIVAAKCTPSQCQQSVRELSKVAADRKKAWNAFVDKHVADPDIGVGVADDFAQGSPAADDLVDLKRRIDSVRATALESLFTSVASYETSRVAVMTSVSAIDRLKGMIDEVEGEFGDAVKIQEKCRAKKAGLDEDAQRQREVEEETRRKSDAEEAQRKAPLSKKLRENPRLVVSAPVHAAAGAVEGAGRLVADPSRIPQAMKDNPETTLAVGGGLVSAACYYGAAAVATNVVIAVMALKSLHWLYTSGMK